MSILRVYQDVSLAWSGIHISWGPRWGWCQLSPWGWTGKFPTSLELPFCCTVAAKNLQELPPREYSPEPPVQLVLPPPQPLLEYQAFGLVRDSTLSLTSCTAYFHVSDCWISTGKPSVQRQCNLFLICGTVWTLIRTDNKEHKPIGTLLGGIQGGMLAWWQLSFCSLCKKHALASKHVEKIGNISMIPKCVHPCEQKLPSWLLCADEMGTLVIYGQNKGCSICVVVVQCS